MTPPPPTRHHSLDFLRGLAVLLMIIFHLFYDLNHFQLIAIDMRQSLFWWLLPRFIVFLFLLCVGLALHLTHHPAIHWSKALKRFSYLFACAILITLLTYFIFPGRWVLFGTLHCIATSSLLALPLVRYPTAALFLVPLFFLMPFLPLPSLATLWPTESVDSVPLIPWFGVVCFGIYLGHRQILEHFPLSPLWKAHPLIRPLLWGGRHSLLIYLGHQLILYPLCYALSAIIS